MKKTLFIILILFTSCTKPNESLQDRIIGSYNWRVSYNLNFNLSFSMDSKCEVMQHDIIAGVKAFHYFYTFEGNESDFTLTIEDSSLIAVFKFDNCFFKDGNIISGNNTLIRL